MTIRQLKGSFNRHKASQKRKPTRSSDKFSNTNPYVWKSNTVSIIMVKRLPINFISGYPQSNCVKSLLYRMGVTEDVKKINRVSRSRLSPQDRSLLYGSSTWYLSFASADDIDVLCWEYCCGINFKINISYLNFKKSTFY